MEPAAWADPGSVGRPAGLVERAAHGDQSAWDELVRLHSPTLWRVARGYRLSREDAADAVQVTWLRLAEHIHQIPDPHRISSWLVTTIRRESIRLRRLRATLPPDQVRPAADADQPEAVADVTDEQLLLTAFNRLPDRDRLLLGALMASPPSSYAEVARELGLPRGSIGPTRQRALRRLRSEIAALTARRQDAIGSV